MTDDDRKAPGTREPPEPPEQQSPGNGGGDQDQGLPGRRGPFSPRPALRFWLLMLLLLGAYLVFFQNGIFAGRAIPYSEFKQRLQKGEVSKCQVAEDRITGTITPKATEAGKKEDAPAPFSFHTLRIEDPDLIKDLAGAGVEYTGVPSFGAGSWILVWLGLGLLFLLLVLPFLASRVRAPGSVLAFGRSKAKLVANLDTGVTFEDVAGCAEAKQELREVVDFLANPQRYVALGARIPKGMILIGGPGTGKTLLARAVAGEAGVPFFSISGSEFVEMFVGVGAARVRDLFEQALKKAPCIVFIDEIDAVGRARGVHMSAVSDEREQTLNQLLVEMDGFEANNGVILLAATNRPDVLDRALLRPGRFDRQVVLDAPDLSEREAILEVHARGKRLSEGIDLREVARATPGLAGADLANILNEAALLAARRRGETIGQVDIEAATERVVAGPERRSRRMHEQDKRRVACHESGHALVAHYSEYADPVHKISIVPRGHAALGFTIQLPEEEQLLLTKSQLHDKVAGLLGGRAAEELMLGDVSTGASDDLERATTLVRQMVCTFGMGESAGLMHCAREVDGRFSPRDQGLLQRDCSEDTAREIDAEVKQILDQIYAQVMKLLGEHRPQLERVTRVLTERETLSAEAFRELIAGSAPNGS